MEENINELFSPEGAIGRLLTGYVSVAAEPRHGYLINTMIKKAGIKDGVLRPCMLDEYTFYRDKKRRFRPGDVIYAAAGPVYPRMLRLKLNKCVTSIASLYLASGSFCIDIAAAGGETAADIAEKTYFVLPSDTTARAFRRISYCSGGLTECGLITCDGMITFLKNGEPYAAAPRASLPKPADGNKHVIKDMRDFTAGCLCSFAKTVSRASPSPFPAALPLDISHANELEFRLGICACCISERKDRTLAQKEAPAQKALELVPLPYFDGMPMLPQWHAMLEKLIAANAYRGYAALCLTDSAPDELTNITEAGGPSLPYAYPPAARGSIAILTEE